MKSMAPEITNSDITTEHSFFHADEIDVFACGCVLFELVMKAQPFKSSNTKDANYSHLVNNETSSFWGIFSKINSPSYEFKSTPWFMVDLIERMLDPNPKSRISLPDLKKHPWFLGEVPSKNEFKK